MSWSQKKSKLSGNTIIDGTIEGDQLADDTVTFAKLNGVKDEDDFASNSDTALATQQSIKAYVDELLDKKETQYNDSHINLYKHLTTSYQTIFRTFKTREYTEKRLQTAKFQFSLQSGSGTYRNDALIQVVATVPYTTTAYSLGTATYLTTTGQYVDQIHFSGDITDKLTCGGSIGLNLDSSTYFADRTMRSFHYDVNADLTIVEYSSYPSKLVNYGSPVEVFFDPFHWISSGQDLTLESYFVEVPYNSQNVMLTLETRLGYFNQKVSYKLQAKEQTTGDTLQINDLRHTQKARKL